MADDLKRFFDRALVVRIADDIARAWPAFPAARFIEDASRDLPSLELMARAQRIADALAAHLPADFPSSVAIVVASLGPPIARDEFVGGGMAPFFYLPHTRFVAARGLDHVDLALDAQHALTQRFTCEFSIRAFIARHPEATFARLARWVADPSPHVRRLVSEGTRPRLPWGARVAILDAHPERALALLEALRDDPSPMVRRSVANHLNDLTKTHPDLAFAVCARWLADAPPERRALVVHALRSAVKRGDARALGLMGHGERAEVRVTDGRCAPARVPIGGRVTITATVTSAARRAQSLNVDLEVRFVKARGTSPKVFKVTRATLAPGASLAVSKSVSLAVHTTRTPRPGRHEVALRINGAAHPLGSFEVT